MQSRHTALCSLFFFVLLLPITRPHPTAAVVLAGGAARASTRAYRRTCAGRVTRKTFDPESLNKLFFVCFLKNQSSSHDARNVVVIRHVRVSVLQLASGPFPAGPCGTWGVWRSRALMLGMLVCCLFCFSLFFAPHVVRARCLARRNFATLPSVSTRRWVRSIVKNGVTILLTRWRRLARRWLHHVHGRGLLPSRSRRGHRACRQPSSPLHAAPLHWTAQSVGSRQKLRRQFLRSLFVLLVTPSNSLLDVLLVCQTDTWGAPRARSAGAPRAQHARHSPAPAMTCASDSGDDWTARRSSHVRSSSCPTATYRVST